MEYFRRPRHDSLPAAGPADATTDRGYWFRGKRQRVGAGGAGNPFVQHRRRKVAVSVLSYWIRHIWVDALTILIVGMITVAVYLSPLVGTRYFPISTDPAVNAHLSYPYRDWAVSSVVAAIVSLGVPFLVILAFNLARLWSIWDFTNACMGTIYAFTLAMCVHALLKILITGFRPYFLTVCDPDPVKVAAGGVGLDRLYFSADVCRQPDRALLKQAMTSFPSGHAACGFAGLGFLSLYLNGKIKPWANYRPMSWEMPLVLAPLLGALLLACSVLVHADHHASDVVAGSLIGCASALAMYRAFFAAVWDWRFNHVALRPKEVVEYEYAAGENAEGVMLHKGTWRSRVARNVDEQRKVAYWRRGRVVQEDGGPAAAAGAGETVLGSGVAVPEGQNEMGEQMV